ncbi:hypothetical protein NPIL_521431 [Nephila pilipes]|uniref:Uncharacterized protein n=1 Tax=Nephila pilipes TaxID=299642 RepID=A0A8X6R772_NEPPI|nr:hypothetical protein NPIL_521431 [Nephila pilipes]
MALTIPVTFFLCEQPTPPQYNVGNITTNVALFWSKNDKLADAKDVHLLEAKLKSCVSMRPCLCPTFVDSRNNVTATPPSKPS